MVPYVGPTPSSADSCRSSEWAIRLEEIGTRGCTCPGRSFCLSWAVTFMKSPGRRHRYCSLCLTRFGLSQIECFGHLILSFGGEMSRRVWGNGYQSAERPNQCYDLTIFTEGTCSSHLKILLTSISLDRGSFTQPHTSNQALDGSQNAEKQNIDNADPRLNIHPQQTKQNGSHFQRIIISNRTRPRALMIRLV